MLAEKSVSEALDGKFLIVVDHPYKHNSVTAGIGMWVFAPNGEEITRYYFGSGFDIFIYGEKGHVGGLPFNEKGFKRCVDGMLRWIKDSLTKWEALEKKWDSKINQCKNEKCKCNGKFIKCLDAESLIEKCKGQDCKCNTEEPRAHYETEELWKKIINGCWSKAVQFKCNEGPKRDHTQENDKSMARALKQALEEAKKQNKLVFYISDSWSAHTVCLQSIILEANISKILGEKYITAYEGHIHHTHEWKGIKLNIYSPNGKELASYTWGTDPSFVTEKLFNDKVKEIEEFIKKHNIEENKKENLSENEKKR